MDTLAITYTDTDSKGRYAAALPGITEEAELTLSKVTPQLIIADHTYVPDAMRGKGVAGALIERLLADARAAGQRVVPLCPVVRAYAARRRSELEDVIQW